MRVQGADTSGSSSKGIALGGDSSCTTLASGGTISDPAGGSWPTAACATCRQGSSAAVPCEFGFGLPAARRGPVGWQEFSHMLGSRGQAPGRRPCCSPPGCRSTAASKRAGASCKASHQLAQQPRNATDCSDCCRRRDTAPPLRRRPQRGAERQRKDMGPLVPPAPAHPCSQRRAAVAAWVLPLPTWLHVTLAGGGASPVPLHARGLNLLRDAAVQAGSSTCSPWLVS